MSKSISKKIQNIYQRLVSAEGKKEEMYRHHYAVAVRNGEVITPLSHNQYRVNVFGEVRGTMHAEMSAINNLLNSCKVKGSFVRHSTHPKKSNLKRSQNNRQRVLQTYISLY